MNRREFSKSASAGTATLGLVPTILTGAGWKGANDRVNIGVIGIRGQGQNHIEGYSNSEHARVIALCDVDSNLFDERIKKHFTDKGLPKPVKYTDLRRLYENKDIEAVSVVTPNHWHAPASIWAMQAGKHVSVEKPCCYNFFEGQKIVEAAEKYKLIVQDGAEQRSNPCAQSMAEYLHSGKLGEVYMAKGLCYKWRDTIGKSPEKPVLPGVDYDLWLGPAPKRPFTKNRFQYNWHWITNREGINSDNATPGNSYMTSSENTVGNLFFGSKGFMTKNVNEWQTFLGKERTPGDKGSGLGDHYLNFIEAIRVNDQKLAMEISVMDFIPVP